MKISHDEAVAAIQAAGLRISSLPTPAEQRQILEGLEKLKAEQKAVLATARWWQVFAILQAFWSWILLAAACKHATIRLFRCEATVTIIGRRIPRLEHQAKLEAVRLALRDGSGEVEPLANMAARAALKWR